MRAILTDIHEITSYSVIGTWLICPCMTDTVLEMMKAVCSFETSGPAWPVKQHNLPEEQNFWIKLFYICVLVRIVECAGKEYLFARSSYVLLNTVMYTLLKFCVQVKAR
jgi:hypothetical protein